MKDEALKLALEALETAWTYDENNADGYYFGAITAIKQALALDKKAENARELGLDYEPAPVQEPVQPEQEPVAEVVWGAKTDFKWKFKMLVELACVEDVPVKLYAGPFKGAALYWHNTETDKGTTPPAQPTPEDSSVAQSTWVGSGDLEDSNAYQTPPAAQRQWVGLTGEEILIMSQYDLEYAALIGKVERKLKEKNK